MKKLICALLAGLMLAALFGCGKQNDDDLAYIKGKKKLIVGITENPPMNYYDEYGELVGFDTEFAEALCLRLGVKPEFKIVDWTSKETELKAKNIDCIWSGITVTADRRENMLFTTSYMHNEQVVVIRAENIGTYTTTASLAGVTVAAEDGSAGFDATAEFLPDSKITVVSSQATALLEVKTGTAEAAILDLTMARALTQDGSDYAGLAIVTSIDMWPEEYAIGLRLNSTAEQEFNKIIAELVADGTLSAIAEKYGLKSELITK